MSLEKFLILSAVLFCIGIYGTLTRRNTIVILMSLELMFNAVNIAAVAMSRFVTPASLRDMALPVTDSSFSSLQMILTGQIFALFVIAVSAAEVALGLAIVIAIYRSRDTIDLTQLNLMRW